MIAPVQQTCALSAIVRRNWRLLSVLGGSAARHPAEHVGCVAPRPFPRMACPP
jgi:hypothetical protein